MQKVEKIIIHCAYTKPSMDFVDKDWIEKIHTKEKGYSEIGYHFVIKRDGTLQNGRDVSKQGAHTKANNGNKNSLGICLAGGMSEKNKSECNFTSAQMFTLNHLLGKLKQEYSLDKSKIYGHRDFDKTKDCPCFNVKEWLETGNLRF